MKNIIQLLMLFKNIRWVSHKPNKIYVDECSELYNRSMKL